MQRLRGMNLLFWVAMGVGFAGTRVWAQSCGNHLQMSTAGAATATATTVPVEDLKVPEAAWKHFEKACAAVVLKNSGVFEAESEKALALAPDLPQVYVLRAMLQLGDGQYEPAIASIARARSMRREVAWSSVVLASVLNQMHRFDEAVADLERARWDERATWQWRFERARSAVGRGNATEALHWTEQALKGTPAERTEVKLLRADAFSLANRVAEAVEQLEEYLASGPHLRYQEGARALLARLRPRATGEAKTLVAER